MYRPLDILTLGGATQSPWWCWSFIWSSARPFNNKDKTKKSKNLKIYPEPIDLTMDEFANADTEAIETTDTEAIETIE